MSNKSSIQGGVIDAAVIDTNIGQDHLYAFAPPAGWTGGANEYFELMRQRYNDLMFGQRITFIANFSKKNSVKVIGPFANEARSILQAINKSDVKIVSQCA